MSLSDAQIKCRLLFSLCRRHGWAGAIPAVDLVRTGLQDSDHGRGRVLVEELRREPYIEFRPGTGYRVKNDPDSQAIAAARLITTCGYTALQVEATLSRFEQAGGLEAYDVEELISILDTWE